MHDEDLTKYLGLLDRFLEPMNRRLDEISQKMDQVVHIAERQNSADREVSTLKERVAKVEQANSDHALELATVRGRNTVIMFMLSGIGVPVVLALIANLMGIQL